MADRVCFLFTHIVGVPVILAVVIVRKAVVVSLVRYHRIFCEGVYIGLVLKSMESQFVL
jgi:hypothetical protein